MSIRALGSIILKKPLGQGGQPWHGPAPATVEDLDLRDVSVRKYEVRYNTLLNSVSSSFHFFYFLLLFTIQLAHDFQPRWRRITPFTTHNKHPRSFDIICHYRTLSGMTFSLICILFNASIQISSSNTTSSPFNKKWARHFSNDLRG